VTSPCAAAGNGVVYMLNGTKHKPDRVGMAVTTGAFDVSGMTSRRCCAGAGGPVPTGSTEPVKVAWVEVQLLAFE